ncbi:hypothetical protein [Pantoea sp. EKM20T]|uniref:hypothetical protein n=1 Tax=Pantoea sp. EKM20T TaxID=2708059 RepID=UPI00142DB79B|nr:hypothetical protein [Pantoea sp. EKM20T]KAF6684013.1 hypothetical protein HFD94_08210 [Pantoea sp. EKM20T]
MKLALTLISVFFLAGCGPSDTTKTEAISKAKSYLREQVGNQGMINFGKVVVNSRFYDKNSAVCGDFKIGTGPSHKFYSLLYTKNDGDMDVTKPIHNDDANQSNGFDVFWDRFCG